MSDDVTYQPGYEQPQPEEGRLRESVDELAELVRDSARRTAALDARIDSLPGPMEIASAVESEVERSVREARETIDARVGSLGGELESLSRRLAEVAEALVPLEGLRTEIATVADESAGFRDIRATLQIALEQLAGGKVPTLDTSGPERVGAEVDARLESFRRLLDETAVQIRSDFEVLVRAEQEASERRSDALGLRITNMSVGVTSTLEYLTQQAERIAERGKSIESENAGILQAIRDQVDAMRSAVPRTASDDGALLEAIRGVEGRVRDIESRLSERMSSLEGRVDRKPADGGLEDIREQLNALIAVVEAPTRDPMLQEVRDRVSSLGAPEVPARDPILEEIRVQLERLASATPPAPDQSWDEIRAQLAELASSGVAVSSASASSSDPILNEIRTELFELRGELLELRDREPVARDPMLDEIRAQLDRLTSAESVQPDPMWNDVRTHLERLATSEPPSRDPILDEIRAQLERVASAEPPGRDPILDEISVYLARVASAEPPPPDPTLIDVRAHLERLAAAEPPSRDPMLDEIRAQLSDLIAAEGPPRDPILEEIRDGLTELQRTEPAEAEVPSTESLVSTAVEQLRGALDEAIGAVHDGVARSVGELSLRLDSVEAKIVQVAGDTSDALDGAAAQTAGGLQDLRTALAALTETSSGVERIRQELSEAMESFGTQLVTGTEAVRTSISERTGMLEEKIAVFETPDDLAETLAQRLTSAIDDGTRERDERMAGIEQELGGVASNVNEIWIRVRSIVKRLEEERAATREGSTQTAEQIEALARGEERLGVRVTEAEQRLVQAMRAIETARDRVFLDTLNDLLERMPRRERKLFRRRVREIPPTRGEPVPPPPPQPPAASERRFAPPVSAGRAPRDAGARAPEPSPARAKPKPKPKPKPNTAKPKPKPQVKPTPVQRTTPVAAPMPKPAAKAKPRPKPAEKPKPKPKPPARAATPAAVEEKLPAAKKPATSEPTKRGGTEAPAVVDTHAREQTPSPAEAPHETPPPGEDAEAQNGPSGADQGA